MVQAVLTEARPFLKWAGGKTQVLEHIANHLPEALKQGKMKKYVEPFIGGGAVFFYIAQQFYLQDLYISDINDELILLYRTIQRDVDSLIFHLSQIEAYYLNLNPLQQKAFYYETRNRFNQNRLTIDFSQFNHRWVERSAHLLFLNRTCYNGLFRVNASGSFNVPFGRYKNPKICFANNLRAVAQVLQRTTILDGDFTACEKFVDAETFVYFDPPYRPISKTANFNAYSRFSFNDDEQIRLAQYFSSLDQKHAKLMLSNSDPTNENPSDHFFDDAFRGFYIHRIPASRMINSKVSKRGKINELLILNYSCQPT